MSSIDLSPSQRTLLTALVNLHGGGEGAVKGEAIADEIDRNPGTIRNQMQSLKALQLVEGVPGPKGGYRPTTEAYEALDVQRMDDAAHVPVVHEGTELPDVTVEEIDLTNVHHPELCRAEVVVQGPVSDVGEGDELEVGPTPLSKLVVEGEVDAVDGAANTIILRITRMEAPAEPPDK